ncbi:MAG: hypothetical protein NZ992_00605 [Candidatus Korarchaeum sp.]|nr:hypothetical protein [Candidatus Korarchaeum sp.]MDW8035232.1 hypothetical protein [Candidatus Korarchaeum sp.]
MRTRRSPEVRTIDLLRLTQDFVIGVSASLSSGLMAISCYREVAVEGVPAKVAVYQKLGKMRSYLAGLLEGGDEKSSSEVAMSLLSRLYEIDLESRQRWIQLSLSASISISILVSFLSIYKGMNIDPLLPLILLPLYFLLPSFTSLEIPDPALADAIANDLEVGSGKIYAMRHLGIYERIVVDDGELEIPSFFRYAMAVSSKETSASLMRRTANMLKDLESIVASWHAGMESSRRLFISLVVLVAGVNLGICFLSEKVFLKAPLGFLFTSGLVSSILASRPLKYPLESSLAYAISFSIGRAIIGL